MKLRDLMGEIDSAYGAGMVAQASRGRTFKTKRFPTLMFDFDLATGGGVPWKRFIQIYGPESGGKSVLMAKIMAAAQLNCRYCRARFTADKNGEVVCDCEAVCEDCSKPFQATEYDGPPATDEDAFDWSAIHDEWICECLVNPPGTKTKKDRVPKVTRRCSPVRAALFDAENSFDARWSTCLGVDNSLLFVFVPEYAEQGIDIADKLLRSNEIDILAVDSIAELTPSKEIEASTEEWQMGLQARLVNKALRKWNSSINALGANAEMCPAIILVNQVRANLGGYEEVCPGGAGQKYKSSIRVRVNVAKYSFKEYGSGADKVKELKYVDISGFTKKNKTSPPMKRFSMRLYLDDFDGHPVGSMNEFSVVVTRAIEFGVIERPTKTTYKYTDDAFELSWTSQKKIVEDLKKDQVLFWAMRETTLAVALKTIR